MDIYFIPKQVYCKRNVSKINYIWVSDYMPNLNVDKTLDLANI